MKETEKLESKQNREIQYFLPYSFRKTFHFFPELSCFLSPIQHYFINFNILHYMQLSQTHC